LVPCYWRLRRHSSGLRKAEHQRLLRWILWGQ